MLTELHRIFMGDHDLTFMVEIAFRTLIIYSYTLALMRWIGGRSVAQLSIVEFLLVIAIGSAVGDSLFYPDVPLIPAMLAILLVVLCNKAIDGAILRSDRFSRMLEGQPQIVVSNGRIHAEKLRCQGMGQQELFMKLRDKGVSDLREVALAVLEPNGAISILRREDGGAGKPDDLFAPPAIPADQMPQ